jgi:hypothetical protein
MIARDLVCAQLEVGSGQVSGFAGLNWIGLDWIHSEEVDVVVEVDVNLSSCPSMNPLKLS